MTHIEYGHLTCKYCGKDWRHHYDQYCLGWRDAGGTFCPEGYNLDEECKRCGKVLSDHFKHFYCYQTSDLNETFQKVDDYLPEELFTI